MKQKSPTRADFYQMMGQIILPVYISAFERLKTKNPPITINDWMAFNLQLMSSLGTRKYLEMQVEAMEQLAAQDPGFFDDQPAIDAKRWVNDNIRRMRDLGGPEQWLIWELTESLGREPDIDIQAVRAKTKEIKQKIEEDLRALRSEASSASMSGSGSTSNSKTK